MEVNKEEEKYLMFYLNEEFYGIPILKVNEIIGLMEIISIPRSPNFMKGIINLRGKIIPVVDLRLKFNMGERAYDEQTCIIIVQNTCNNKKTFIGLVVDKVAEVVNISNASIESPPQYGQDDDSEFLTGIGKVKEKVVMLLDIDLILNCHSVVSILTEAAKQELIAVEPEVVEFNMEEPVVEKPKAKK